MFSKRWLALSILAAVGCSEPSGPPAAAFSLLIQAGDQQFGLVNGTLTQPLQVVALDPVSKRPRSNVTVQWRVVSGQGASITQETARTGSNGVALATVRLGPALGSYTFEATAAGVSGGPVRWTARAVELPVITAVAPRQANVRDTVTIVGANFSTATLDNAVLFDGLRGRVVSASATELRVEVPACTPARTVRLTVALGAVTSAAESITIQSPPQPPLQLNVGQALLLRDAAEFACVQLDLANGARFLLIQQNASETVGSLMPFELNSLAGALPAVASTVLATRPAADFAAAWEARLRARERAFAGVTAERMPSALRMAPPALGDRASFQVFDRNNRFVTVTAEIKAISERALIYQDLNAPANGFSTTQLEFLGSQFDNPAYEIDVAVFGEPTDVDANGKIIILLTPVVNELTPRGSSGFVAGFFYGCDLQTRAQCSGSNSGEIFYLMVPDPTGRHSDVRTASSVMNAVRPVLAHEFQHMISFGARRSLDALWLSEGLAHHAEDLLADEFRNRGDLQSAALFSAQNYARARMFLSDSTHNSLITEELPGSLEQRGAGWLLVKYLAGHYGGASLLRTLTRASLTGSASVTAATGQAWGTLLSDWAVALWADDAPELNGIALSARHTFNNMDLRQELSPTGSASYPLRITTIGFEDVFLSGHLAASSQRHAMLTGTALPLQRVHLAFTGQHGGPFAPASVPQLTLLRVR